MKKILLVDDDPFIRDVYLKQLQHEGYHVDMADTSQKALEKITATHPDLLILDLNLGGSEGPRDGIDILKFIRENQTTKNLKIIVISNYNKDQYPELSQLPYFGVLKTFSKVQTTLREVTDEIHKILN